MMTGRAGDASKIGGKRVVDVDETAAPGSRVPRI
jgi:hypothetical protein